MNNRSPQGLKTLRESIVDSSPRQGGIARKIIIKKFTIISHIRSYREAGQPLVGGHTRVQTGPRPRGAKKINAMRDFFSAAGGLREAPEWFYSYKLISDRP